MNRNLNWTEEDGWDVEMEDAPQVEHLAVKLENIMKVVQQNTQEIHRLRAQLLDLLRAQHKEHLKQLKACQTAFQMNVERDEALRETIHESADPWSGC